MSHDLAVLPEKFAPLAAILENLRGARTDLNQFVGELLNRLDDEQRRQADAQSRFAEERDALRDQIEEADEDISPLELMKRLDRAYPPYPVNHDRVQSLYHGSTRV